MRSLRRPSRSRSKSSSLSRATVSVLMSKLEDRLLFAGFVVSNLNDSEVGSLREAIRQADLTAGADTITFAPGLTGTINLFSELQINDSAGVDIQGPGSGLTVSGNDASRVFNIPSGAAAKISGLTITHGKSSLSGGNIHSNGTLDISNCVISNGNGIQNGGGISNGGVMTITDSTITNNRASASVGGGVFNGGTLTVLRSTISNNSGAFGAGIANFNTLNVTASLISANQGDGLRTQSQGPGTYRMVIRDSTIIGNDAGVFGLSYGDSRIVVLNSTIANNRTGIEAGNNGGFNPEPPSIDAWITAINCTVTQNTTGLKVFSTAYTELANTAVSGNTTDVDGQFTDIANNYIGGNAMLAALASNGGPTQTYRPMVGSPLIDAGNTNLARYFGPDGIIGTGDDVPLTTDQREGTFARVKGARVDIGAFEANYVNVVVSPDRSTLLVEGTSDNDTISAAAVPGSPTDVDITANNTYVGRYTFSGRLILQGGDGDDTITVDPRLTRDVIVFGGAGNDVITTGRGNDVIVGGDGADHLSSVSGGDILIGGLGEDLLESGNGNDILIGGRTSYDAKTDDNIKALGALSDAWNASILYPINALLITFGVGPSHPYKLNATTVFDDGAKDVLKGGSGFDWFLGNFAGSGIKDTTDRGLLDLVTDL